MRRSILMAVVLLAACAGAPTAPEVSSTKMNTPAMTCCGGSQHYVPAPTKPSVPSPCPFFMSLSCVMSKVEP